MTITSAAPMAATTCGGRPRRLDAVEADLADLGRLVAVDEVLLEVEPALVGPDLRSGPARRPSAGSALGIPSARLELEHGLGRWRSPSRSRHVRAMCVREVAVAEPEPGLLAVALPARPSRSTSRRACPQPRSSSNRPAEHVHDRVVVGHDEQAVALGVVAGVDDDASGRPARGPPGGRGPVSRRRSRRRGRRPSRVMRRGARGPRPSARWSRGRTGRASGR